MLRFLFVSFFVLLPGLAQARLFKLYTPDDVAQLSSIICNGVVVSLTNVGEEPQQQYSLSRAIHWKAHLKILFYYKGSAPPEIDFYYTQPRRDMMDGSIFFTLKEGSRYRFFLNPAPNRIGYVSALDTNIDNRWAVESLGPSEAEASPPLFRNEALQLALAFFNLNQPALSKTARQELATAGPEERAGREESFSGDADPNIWTVQFWFRKGNVQTYGPDAEVRVRGDRTTAHDSWIATTPPLTPAQLTSHDVGRLCWIRLSHQLQNDVSGSRDLHGLIQSVASQAIVLENVQSRSGNHHWPTLTVPLDHIRVVQPLIPTP